MFDHPNPNRPRSGADPVFRALPVGALGLLALGAIASCGYDPGHAPVHWSLSQSTLDQFEDNGIPDASAAHLEGALTMMFGDGEAPRFLQTEDMYDEEIYPNDGGKGELSEEALDEVVQHNRARRFERQIELIEAGRFEDVPEPIYAEDLWEAWRTEFAPLLGDTAGAVLAAGVGSEGEDAEEAGPVDPDSPHPEPYYTTEDNMLWLGDPIEGATWRQEAIALFTTWYPSMKESAEMYRQQCLHCHGPEGGGDGPTAAFLVPRPRDYRPGKFKRVSVDRNGRPTRDDLHIILKEGVYGSAMPNFGRFSRGELEGLVDYVRLLSMRGENEIMLASATVNSDNGGVPLGEVEGTYDLIWDRWNSAPDKIIGLEGDVPRPEEMTAERIEHGRELFNGTVANCYTCHGSDGRGNGESAYEDVALEDEDGNAILDEDGNPASEKRRRLDEWGNDTLPRNFRLGEYRFGNRPLDVYRRIKVGISGTIMPAADPALSDDDIWDLVYYVRSIAEQYDVARITERKHEAIRARHAAEAHGDAHEQGESHEGESPGEEGSHDEEGEGH